MLFCKSQKFFLSHFSLYIVPWCHRSVLFRLNHMMVHILEQSLLSVVQLLNLINAWIWASFFAAIAERASLIACAFAAAWMSNESHENNFHENEFHENVFHENVFHENVFHENELHENCELWRNSRYATCAEKALVEATPISGPACK